MVLLSPKGCVCVCMCVIINKQTLLLLPLLPHSSQQNYTAFKNNASVIWRCTSPPLIENAIPHPPRAKSHGMVHTRSGLVAIRSFSRAAHSFDGMGKCSVFGRA